MITISNTSSGANPKSKINPAIEKVIKQLRGLSNKKLLSDLEDLNNKERKLQVLVLLYISEIDNRDLYLPMGYTSLFEFCMGHLGYTRSTAARRIRSARTAAKHPKALEMLRSGEINITTLSMISEILDRDNHSEILSGIKHRSTRYVEMLVSRHKPVSVIRDTVRPVCVARRVQESVAVTGSNAEINHGGRNDPASVERLIGDHGSGTGTNSQCSDFGTSTMTKPATMNADTADKHINNNSRSSLSAGTKLSVNGHSEKVVLEQRLKLGFTVSPEFMQKYNKIKSLLSNKHSKGINFAMLFEILMDEYLEKHDPERRHSKRENRVNGIKRHEPRASTRVRSGGADRLTNRSKHARSSASTGKGGFDAKSTSARTGRNQRRISKALRDRVYARDKGRCTFVGANGKRCNSTWDLEIDHIIPVARGGDDSPDNLRLLCRKHNIQQAEKVYGRKFMKHHCKRE